MKLYGPCSQFGGVGDVGMVNDTGLAFYEWKESQDRPDLFLSSSDPSMRTWALLRTSSFYCALNIPYGADRKWAQQSKWRITNGKGAFVVASLVDRGPGAAHRVVDLSPGIMKMLNLSTDDFVTVEEILTS